MTRFHNGKTKAGMAVILLILGFCLLSKIVIGISALRDNVYVMREIAPVDSDALSGYSHNEQLDHLNTITADVSLSGWAILESEELPGAENRTVTLLFEHAQTGRFFSVPTQIMQRARVANSLLNNGWIIQNDQVGYYTTFSPILLPDGYYILHYAIQENDATYAVVRSWQIFEKKGRQFDNYSEPAHDIPSSALTDISDFETGQAALDFQGSVDGLEYTPRGLHVYGWGFAGGADCKEQELVLEITDNDGQRSFYSTNTVPRAEIALATNETDKLFCGYYALIPDYTGRVSALRCHIKNDGEYSHSPYFYFNEDGSLCAGE